MKFALKTDQHSTTDPGFKESYTERVDTATFTERLLVAQWDDVTGNATWFTEGLGGWVISKH